MFVLTEQMLQNEVTLERTNRDFYRLGSFILDNEGWGGFAKWFKKSSDDEQSHADGFAGFLVDRNIDPVYNTISTLAPAGKNPLEYMNAAYAAEQKTTAAIEAIYKTAHDEGEFLVTQFLQFYLAEQKDSEREVWDIIQMLEATDEWRLIDEKLGE